MLVGQRRTSPPPKEHIGFLCHTPDWMRVPLTGGFTQWLFVREKNLSPTEMERLLEPATSRAGIPLVQVSRCLLPLSRGGVSSVSRTRVFPYLGPCGRIPLAGAIQPLMPLGREGYLGQTSSCGIPFACTPGYVVSRHLAGFPFNPGGRIEPPCMPFIARLEFRKCWSWVVSCWVGCSVAPWW